MFGCGCVPLLRSRLLVVLMLTTVAPWASTSSVKSGSPRTCAEAAETDASASMNTKTLNMGYPVIGGTEREYADRRLKIELERSRRARQDSLWPAKLHGIGYEAHAFGRGLTHHRYPVISDLTDVHIDCALSRKP